LSINVGRVAVPEVPDPATYEGVDLSHDDIDRHQQPGPVREFTDAVSGTLDRPAGRPAGEEQHALGPGPTTGAQQPMVKAEEVEALALLGQVHDPGLGRLRFQTEVGQQYRKPRERDLGLLSG